jgi:hypothetical protein
VIIGVSNLIANRVSLNTKQQLVISYRFFIMSIFKFLILFTKVRKFPFLTKFIREKLKVA